MSGSAICWRAFYVTHAVNQILKKMKCARSESKKDKKKIGSSGCVYDHMANCPFSRWMTWHTNSTKCNNPLSNSRQKKKAGIPFACRGSASDDSLLLHLVPKLITAARRSKFQFAASLCAAVERRCQRALGDCGALQMLMRGVGLQGAAA